LAGEFLARLDPNEAEIAARLMVGRAIEQGDQKRLRVSGRAIWKIVAEIVGGEERDDDIFATASDFGEAIEILLRLRPSEPEPSLTIAAVADRFVEIAAIEGRDSRRRKLDALRDLFERATTTEGKYLAKILIGEMRHGMSEGLMLEAIAKMADRPVAEIRRAHMLEADLGRVVRMLRAAPADPAELALDADIAGPAPRGEPARTSRIKPMRPMLAAPAPNVAEAFRILGDKIALEHKLDGARVQIHCVGGEVRIFSRRLNEITPSLPEVVEMMAHLDGRGAIIDGEVIAIDSSGAALAFQELMRRFGRSREIDRVRAEQPIRLFAFDLMALDGSLMIDDPYERRYAVLCELVANSAIRLPGRIIPASCEEGGRFYAHAIAFGHEGVMAKALASLYTPGARGRGWLKIKHARTLDLVIVAADWGYGRRHGWLSNYHLAARGSGADEFVEVGKTFKGMTDADFQAMTERLLALKTGESAGTVRVRPEVVVEVAFSDIQRSPQYAGGMALRFARIVGVRTDKSAGEADTIDAVATEFERQTVKPLSANE
jgi:DNA ligase-1